VGCRTHIKGWKAREGYAPVLHRFSLDSRAQQCIKQTNGLPIGLSGQIYFRIISIMLTWNCITPPFEGSAGALLGRPHTYRRGISLDVLRKFSSKYGVPGRESLLKRGETLWVSGGGMAYLGGSMVKLATIGWVTGALFGPMAVIWWFSALKKWRT